MPSVNIVPEVMVLDIEVLSPRPIFGTLAISNAPLLSSKTLQCKVGLVEHILNPTALSSFTSSIIGMVVCRAMERPINSLSVELRAFQSAAVRPK